MSRVCGIDGVLIRVCSGMVRRWFDMDLFRELRRMQCSQILTLLAIAGIAEVGWDATGFERFSFKYELKQFIFRPPVSGMTRKRADGTEATERGHDEIRPVFREKFYDHGMSCDFAEQPLHLFLEKGNVYTEYSMLEK